MSKEQGSNKIYKTRILHIYEADYSALLGIIWRQLIQSSERFGTLNPGQLGGQTGQDANTLTLMGETKNEICHCSQKWLINVDNDASA
eukprot:11416638-Ditylum_brightwellii.AAC.1